MYKKITFLFLSLVVNFLLAYILYSLRREALPVEDTALGYISGHALVYWLRPFLFVALARAFYLVTKRAFTDQVAVSVYIIAWAVMLVGMIYI